jgi:Rrf2 family protein
VEFIAMLSQKARYALRALFLLAKRPQGTSVTIAEIASEARVPRKFLEQILLELRKRGMLHSVRGKHGGYTLGRPPDKISFAEVIRAIDGPLALSPCVSVTAYRRCDDCVDEATCTLRKVLLAVRDSTAHILETRTLGDDIEPAVPAPKKTRRAAPALA